MDRRLAALFLTALLGVVGVVGLALSAWTPWALLPYGAVVLAGLVVLVRARPLATKREDGRTCSCCTSTVFDPIEVR